MIELPKGAHRGRRRYFAKVNPRFEVEVAETGADLLIYDEISPFGVSATQIRQALDEIDAPDINVRINSPGGDVFDGIAIHNDLRAHPADIHVHVVGLAASAASLIAMAGDTITMADNAHLMIHNAWTLAVGDHNDLREMADILQGIDTTLARTYASRTGVDVDDVTAMMDAETWLSADQAIELGFAEGVGENEDVKALFDLTVFNRVPNSVKRQIEGSLRDAGYSKSEAIIACAKGFHALGRSESGNPSRSESVDQEVHASLEAAIQNFRV